jgi:dihydrodipicolinate synthase/N-acetylneuraminate lyase
MLSDEASEIAHLGRSNMLTRHNFVGPWAGLPVAWTDDDEFDEATYRADVARCCQAQVPGVYTGGTTGEFYAQEWGEFQRIARATVEECRRYDKPAMIGCTATSTRGAALRAAFAAEIQADAIQVALPFWMEVPDEQVLPFFCEVVRASGGLPLSVYETARAKKCLTVSQHLEIHEALPQYLMVKSVEGTVGDTVEGCRELSAVVNVFVDEARWAPLGPHGAIGCCSSMVYWNPWVVLRNWGYLRDSKWSVLEEECRKTQAMFEAIFAAFGPRGFTDTAYDRLGGRAMGFLRTSLSNRGPYASPREDDIQTMRQIFEQHYPEMASQNELGKLI